MSRKAAPKGTRSRSRKSDGDLSLPVLPLRDVVVYPGMVIPLFVGRKKSIRAVEAAMAASKQILLLTQKKAETDDPGPEHIYSIGTVGSILQLLELPDGTVKVLVEGASRARAERYEHTDDYFSARVGMLAETAGAEAPEIEGLVRSLHKGFEQYVKVNKKIPPEALASLSGIDNASRLTDTVSAHMTLNLEEKQKILEILSVRERIEALLKLIESELDILSLEKQIRGRVKQQMEKSQREYYLNEQMKAIQHELSDNDEGMSEIDELAAKIEKVGMSAEAKKKAMHELGKLRMMSPMSAEATVVRNYIDWLVNVPWKKRSRVWSRPQEGRAGSGEGPLCSGQGQGAHSGIPRGAEPREKDQGPDPVPGRPAGGRQDQPGTVDRPRHRARVQPHVAGRGARRGRDPWAPAHLHRFPAREDHPEHVAGRGPEPAVPARRDRQDGDGFPVATRHRRCWRCWIPSRTTCSAITTWRWTSICRT